jgi:hypothetical protein
MKITQAIKRWLQKLSGWWPWKKATPETEYVPVRSLSNKNITQETISRSAVDGMTPQSGVAPLVLGQGETSCSTIDEWPEPVKQQPSSSSPPPSAPMPPPSISTTSSEKTETSTTPALETAPEPTKIHGQEERLAPFMPAPTAEQKLEFLQYLIKRGIVNEGFAEGQTPEQYRT